MPKVCRHLLPQDRTCFCLLVSLPKFHHLKGYPGRLPQAEGFSEEFICFRKPVEGLYITLPVLKVLMAFLLRNPGVCAGSDAAPGAGQGGTGTCVGCGKHPGLSRQTRAGQPRPPGPVPVLSAREGDPRCLRAGFILDHPTPQRSIHFRGKPK